MGKISIPKYTERDFRVMAVEAYQRAKHNKTCISYWYQKIKDNIPEIMMPETHFIRYSRREFYDIFDGKEPSKHIGDVAIRIQQACDIVGYPAFLKDGTFSGKHQWKETCFIESKEVVKQRAINIVHGACMVGLEPSLFFVVRKMIKTSPAFVAFGGMPITCERRYFVRDGKIYFHHPYWPPYSIKSPDKDNWETLLDELNKESEDEINLLSELTLKVGNLLGDGWSVDWLKDIDGNWWLTDMAEDYKSFMWKEYIK